MKPKSRIRYAGVVAIGCAFAAAIWHWRSDSPSADAISEPATIAMAQQALQQPVQDAVDPSLASTRSTATPSHDFVGHQKEIEAKVSAGDYPAAHALVDARLASPGLSAAEKQQWHSTKLGLYGRSGDHAGMVALMDDIIASDPDSAIAQKMAKQRAFVQDFAQRDPHDSGMCATCNGQHAEGEPHLPQEK